MLILELVMAWALTSVVINVMLALVLERGFPSRIDEKSGLPVGSRHPPI